MKKEKKPALNKEQLLFLQRLPLPIKIAKSKQRIREYVDRFGIDGIYVSFSGGLDSTVLLHLTRSIYPDTPGVFCNTGLEWPELVSFVKSTENVVTIRPPDTFKTVLQEEGYPVVNKKVSMMIKRIQSPEENNIYSRRLFLEGIKKDGTKGSSASLLPKKYRYLLNAPFKISDNCCKRLKENPLKCYTKSSKRKPLVGVLADEGGQRTDSYLQTGCNSFKGINSQCKALGFWTHQDILEYILRYDLPYCSIYGDIVRNEKGLLYTTGEKRSGCVYCAMGAQYESCPNRYQRLESKHPKIHDYCINQLGFKEVLEYMDIPYKNKND